MPTKQKMKAVQASSNFNKPWTISWNGTDTPKSTFSYYTDQDLSSAANVNSTVTYKYDAVHRITSEEERVTGLNAGRNGVITSQTVGYTNSSTDNTLSGLSYPDGTSLTYAYDAKDDLKTITQGTSGAALVTYGYDAANCTSRNLGNSVGTTYQYDSDERLCNLTETVVPISGAPQTLSFTYGYDSASRISYVKRETGFGDVYSYDASDQLTNVQYNATNPDTTPTSPTRTTAYNYDPAGNRTSVNDSMAGLSSYSVNQALNQYQTLTGGGGPSCGYDTAGNLNALSNAGNSWNYIYDADGHLLQAANGTDTETYRYDALGRRVGHYSSNTMQSTYFVYGQGWNVIEEFQSAGATPFSGQVVEAQRYVLGIGTDEIVTRTTLASNQVLYYSYDGSGNVFNLTDGTTDAIVEQYIYDVYGEPTIMNGGGTIITGTAYFNRYFYSGREYEAATDLYHYRNREYSPLIGRYLQVDPIRHSGDASNFYRFCGNNPVNNLDPTGLDDGSDGGGGFDLGFTFGLNDFGVTFSNPDNESWIYSTPSNGADSGSFAGGEGSDGFLLPTQNSASVYDPTPALTQQSPVTQPFPNFPSLTYGLNSSSFQSVAAVLNGDIQTMLYHPFGDGDTTNANPSATVSKTAPGSTKNPFVGLRGPDFVALNFSFAIPTPFTATLLGWSMTLSIDRNGAWFFGMGPQIGKAPLEFSGSATANWLDQSASPTKAQLSNFLSASSFNGTAGLVTGASETYTPGSGFATGVGLVSPQVGASYNYSVQGPGNTGVHW